MSGFFDGVLDSLFPSRFVRREEQRGIAAAEASKQRETMATIMAWKAAGMPDEQIASTASQLGMKLPSGFSESKPQGMFGGQAPRRAEPSSPPPVMPDLIQHDDKDSGNISDIVGSLNKSKLDEMPAPPVGVNTMQPQGQPQQQGGLGDMLNDVFWKMGRDGQKRLRTERELANDPRYSAMLASPIMRPLAEQYMKNAGVNKPNMQNVNDELVDFDDEANVGRVIPKAPEGSVRRYDPETGRVRFETVPGFIQHTGATAEAESDGRNASDLRYQPAIKGGIKQAEMGVELNMQPQIDSAVLAATAPYKFQKVKDGDVERWVSEADMASRPGGIVGNTDAVTSQNNQANIADTDARSGFASNANRLRTLGADVKAGRVPVSTSLYYTATYKSKFNLPLNDQERSYMAFTDTVKEAVQENLRLAKGTQTEGDAQREAAAIMGNLGDAKYVQDRLNRLADQNDRRIRSLSTQIEGRRSSAPQSSPSVQPAMPARIPTGNGQTRDANPSRGSNRARPSAAEARAILARRRGGR